MKKKSHKTRLANGNNVKEMVRFSYFSFSIHAFEGFFLHHLRSFYFNGSLAFGVSTIVACNMCECVQMCVFMCSPRRQYCRPNFHSGERESKKRANEKIDC